MNRLVSAAALVQQATGRLISGLWPLRRALTLLLLLPLLWLGATSAARAATYTFPGSLHPACNGSNGSYVCTSLTLNQGDSIVIASPKPATITINGNFTADQITVNGSGAASDLKLIVNGTLSLLYLVRLHADVTANAVTDQNGQSTVAGTLTATAGGITLGYLTSVGGKLSATGNISLGQNVVVGGDASSSGGSLSTNYLTSIRGAATASGAVNLGQESVVSGNATSTGGALTLGYKVQVGGAASAVGAVDIGQESTVGGDVASTRGDVNLAYATQVAGQVTVLGSAKVKLAQSAVVRGAVTASSGDVELGTSARVSGKISTTSGRIELLQDAVAGACVQSSSSSRIRLNYNASAAQVCCGTLGSCGTSCVDNGSNKAMPSVCTAPIAPATLIARYNFNESAYAGSTGELKDSAGYTGGPFNGKAQGATLPSAASTSPARSGNPGTCGYASLPGPTNNGGGFIITGLPVSTAAGAKTSVAFWMYWNGTSSVMPIGWQAHDLWLQNGGFGFNTNSSDVYGIANASLVRTWKHVVAVFTNGSVTSNKLYIDGVLQTLSHRTNATNPNANNAVVASTLRIGGYGATNGYRMGGSIDQLRVYNGELSATEVTQLHTETAACTSGSVLHHVELQHASGAGLTCTPDTVTVKACQDAACTLPYTDGLTGTLAASGTGMVVNWPAGAGFSIAAGSSSTTVGLQLTTAGSVLLGTTGLSATPGNGTSCNFGSTACTYTAAETGLLFDVPHHVSDLVQTFTVSAVKKADNSLACVPAFASTSKSVTFSCGYTNPASGTLAVRVAGAALNSAGNAAAACDSGGRAVALAFNANGVASTTLQYADVGQIALNARFAGTGTGDASLVMSGSDSFIAAPQSLAVTGVTAGPIKAGAPFAATVSARNAAGAVTPNFGRESASESVALGWVRLQPSGVGTVDGSFSGSLGAVSGGSASTSNLAWTEVGRGDLLARLNSNNYLGTGMGAFGSSVATGALYCADEGGTCTLPVGVTATVYYGNNSSYAVKTGVTLLVACNNGVFGDPIVGVVKKCWYVATTATNGSVGDFIPHHFDVAASAACGAFSYAGQPFSATVTARNAGGATTLNFDGAAAISPSFAQAVTLGDGGATGLGAMTGASIAATAFTAGVASASPAFTFSSKTTAPQNLLLRAANAGAGSAAVSSAGYTEASMPLRSGRLRLSNAYGSARALLQVPVVAEHWSGSAWMLNSADNCTSLLSTSVAVSNPRTAAGLVSLAVSTPGAVTLANGSGLLSLAAPLPLGSSLTVDLALNLGSTTADQSCHAAHPLTVGAAKPWLRAQNGSCAASADRDPAARASFGIYTPESRKTVHIREMF